MSGRPFSGRPGACRDGSAEAAKRDAHREYVRWRARQIAYARWEPWADAQPAREHVLRLRAAGASYRAIAGAAGVSQMTVHHLLNGCPAHGQRRPDRISAACSARLLAVSADAAGGARRGACGSRRRLQALVALGHPPASLARRTGMPEQRMARLLRGQTRSLRAADVAAVRGVYSELWDTLPPVRTRRQRAAAGAARRRAGASGWPPPMALDDDRIDDPSCRPRTAWRQAAGLPPAVTAPAGVAPARAVPADLWITSPGAAGIHSPESGRGFPPPLVQGSLRSDRKGIRT